MSEEKQIEEMARALCGEKQSNCQGCDAGILCEFWQEASALYNAGYRKQSEGEWIWTENGEADFEKYWVCSVCKEHDFVKTNYCPNCGTKMKGGVTMNTNNKTIPKKGNPTPCDLETVITAQITFIDKGVEIGAAFDALEFSEGIKMGVKSYLNNFAGRRGLDDEQIKVQVFIHEKKPMREEDK